MITICLNKQNLQIKPNCSLQDMLTEQAYTATHFAVAINCQVIPRDQYATIFLQDNDIVDIVMPMQGG